MRALSPVAGATPRRDLLAVVHASPNTAVTLADQLRERLAAADAQIHALVESNEALDAELGAQRADEAVVRKQLDRSKIALRDALKSAAAAGGNKSRVRLGRAAQQRTENMLRLELAEQKQKLSRVESIVAHQQAEREHLVATSAAASEASAAAQAELARIPALKRRAAAARRARAELEETLEQTRVQLKKTSDMVVKLWKRPGASQRSSALSVESVEEVAATATTRARVHALECELTVANCARALWCIVFFLRQSHVASVARAWTRWRAVARVRAR